MDTPKRSRGRKPGPVKELPFQTEYLAWIVKNINKPGKSAAGLGRVIGVHKSGASRIVHGGRPLRLEWVPALAAYFGCEIPEFARLGAGPRVKSGGILEVGVFRGVVQDQDSTVECTPDLRFPPEAQRVFDIAKSGLDALEPRPIFDGDKVLCIDLATSGGWGSLVTGSIVAVSRTLEEDVVERSLRLVQKEKDRLVFKSVTQGWHPKSFEASANDGHIEILGVAKRVIYDL